MAIHRDTVNGMSFGHMSELHGYIARHGTMEASRRIGVTPQTISRWKREKAQIMLATDGGAQVIGYMRYYPAGTDA